MSVIKRRRKTDDGIERDIVTGMIVSDEVLKEIQTLFDPKLMEVPYARTVANWCMTYFAEYNKAPKVHIQDLFKSHKRNELDEDLADLIEDFLADISAEHERTEHFNAQYILDQAEKRFRSKSLAALSEDMKTALASGEPDSAEAMLTGYKRIARPLSGGVNPFIDKDAVLDAFENESGPLFTFPGALGHLLNEHFVREGLIGFMGPEKRGKTWWLMETAIRAARARNNVAFFAVGDMSQRQMIRRFHTRLAGKSYLTKYCGRILVPVLDCVHNQTGICRSPDRECRSNLMDGEKLLDFAHAPDDYKPCSFCDRDIEGAIWYRERPPVEPLTWREGLKTGRKFSQRLKGRDFKLIAYPNSSINVSGLEAQLDIWEHYEGFIPDVIVIDYADILASEDLKANDERQRQNESWKALRRLSQIRKCLIITATQADAASYEAGILKMKHFSEDKRKYGHVTAMVGLNQTPDEKLKGIMRLNMIVVREGEFHSAYSVSVLQSLQMGRPCMVSF